MTINHNSPPKARYVADGNIVGYTFDWRLFDEEEYSDLVIEYDNVAQPISNFAVVYSQEQQNGTVTPSSAPAVGTVIVLRRQTSLARENDYSSINDYRGDVVNREADQDRAIMQEHAEALSRVPQRPPSSASTANLDLPDPVANRPLMWNEAANGFKNGEYDLDTLGDEVAANKDATDTNLTATQTALSQAQAALSQVQSLVVTAQNSAAAAEAALQAFPAGLVKRITASYVIPVSENGYHYVIDGTGGDVDLTAPLGSEALEPFRFSAQRLDSSDNTVRIVASGDNTFNGSASQIVLPYANSGATLALDIDPEPDDWSVATSGALSQLQEAIFYYTATAGQTVFTGADDFARTLGFTPGRIEVYRGPLRIWADRGDYSDASGDAVVLAEAVTAGEEITIIARSSFALADTMSIAEINALIASVPTGEIGAVSEFARETPPNGWLACDGAAVSRTAYPDLFAGIGVSFGDGDGSTTFNLPSIANEETGQNVSANLFLTATAVVAMPGHTLSADGLLMVDGDGATSSRISPNSTSQGVIITLAAAETINRIILKSSHSDSDRITDVHLSGSNNGTDFTLIDSVNVGAGAVIVDQSCQVDFDNEGAFAVYQVGFTLSVGAVGFYEIEGYHVTAQVVRHAIKAFHAAPVPTPGPQGVNKAGDTMTGNLGGPDGVQANHYVTKAQLGAVSLLGYTEQRTAYQQSSSATSEATMPQITDGFEVLSVTVPVVAGRQYMVDALIFAGQSITTMLFAGIFQSGGSNPIAVANDVPTSDLPATLIARGMFLATSTGDLTFSTRVGTNNAGTVSINRRHGGTDDFLGKVSSMTVREVA